MMWPVALEQTPLQTRRGFGPRPTDPVHPAGGTAQSWRLPVVSSEERTASRLIEAWLAADRAGSQVPHGVTNLT